MKKALGKDELATILDSLIADIKGRLTFDGRNRVFNEGKELHSDFMKETADPEAFTREFLLDKIFSALELDKLPEKHFDIPGSRRSVDYKIRSPRGMFLVEAKALNADLEKGKDSGVNQIKGLFKLAEVQKNYEFGVATDGLRWIFIDKNEEIVSDLRLEDDFEQIKEFLIGKEKVVSPKTEEEISKKFYEWYNALLHGGRYKDHENNLKTIAEEDCLVNNVIGVKDLEEQEQIAQVVTNRLIFIKFLQSKGIIGEDILSYLSEVKEEDLTSKLRELFFDTMNTPEDDRFDIDERFRSIPYLNGSLFVRTEVEKKNLDYKIKAEILQKVIEFLDSFTFVHKEQLENGDSIDPEILGYIFERAMTATDRKGTGAYYTPKFVTKYISENTIYPCLIEKTNEFLKTEKGYKETELIENIEQLSDLADTTLKEIWNKIILKVRVLDNACGSGAFLLAAANILFELNREINDKLGAKNPDTTLKFLILVNNLYGVDINPNGIEIAKLRLWLWLVDSYKPEHIQPLPNIDYNLRVGNSLIGYVDVSEFKGAELTLAEWLWDEEKSTLENLLKERNDLIQSYKRAEGEEAKELKGSIQKLGEKINNMLDAELYRTFRDKKLKISRDEFLKLNPFHWGFEFYGAFDLDKPKEERGFDVVIGNPPYVRPHKIDKINKEILWKYFTTFKAKSDLYSCFMEKV
ncbi:MAG TPA: DNA methyltransferase [Desulfobacteria bacterium]|nr:DNA methyltransferase [Desulfobacteria bacterium]